MTDITFNNTALTPPFDPGVSEYYVLLNQNLQQATLNIRLNSGDAVVGIVKAGDTAPPTQVRGGGDIPITLNTDLEPTVFIVAQRYRVQIVRELRVNIATDRQDRTVEEGQPLRLTVEDNIVNALPLTYTWRQTAPSNRLLVAALETGITVDQPEFVITVPPAIVPALENELAITLEVTASGEIAGSPQNSTVQLRILKVDNGVGNLTAPSYVAETSALEVPNFMQAIAADPDGEADDADQNIRYQWQYDRDGSWEDIAGARNARYDTAERNVPPLTRYRLQARYIDEQGYDNTVISQASEQIVDGDRDGLIDIYHLEGLNFVRYRLDGSAYTTGPGDAGLTGGCPGSGCFGYELNRDLDFNDSNSYASGVVNSDWTDLNFDDLSDTGWQPIGEEDLDFCDPSPNSCFTGVFDGNGYTLSNLQINRKGITNNANIALFAGVSGDNAVIRDIGLVNARIESFSPSIGSFLLKVAGLASINEARIINSYIQGRIVVERAVVGGISSWSRGEIINSYADLDIRAEQNLVFLNYVGGLVGRNDGGTIINSYAIGRIGGGHINTAGGLAGANASGRIINSYASVDFDSQTQDDAFYTVGGLVGRLIEGTNGEGALIHNSYASGAIISRINVPRDSLDSVDIGGLVGRVGRGGHTISNSYAAGLVAPSNHNHSSGHRCE